VPSADQIKALVRCHGAGDDARFYAVAMQVAAEEAHAGHTKVAKELREIVDVAKARAPVASSPTPVVQPRGELAGLVEATYTGLRLSDLVVGDDVRASLERVLHEQRQREALGAHGFHPVGRLLLVGPPGTGKTMTASVLAGELALPLLTVRLDGLITKYLGETAAKLRVVFDSVAKTRAVYLFDELDAVAGDRATRNDVGEMRRVVNSFLQFLEQPRSESLIIAATNHPGLLDSALFRRFDCAITYALPTQTLARRVLQRTLASLNTEAVTWRALAKPAATLSHAELVRAAEQAAKGVILAGGDRVTTEHVAAALADRRKLRRA